MTQSLQCYLVWFNHTGIREAPRSSQNAWQDWLSKQWNKQQKQKEPIEVRGTVANKITGSEEVRGFWSALY